jgi:Tfp pilus assembly ATPase PilU
MASRRWEDIQKVMDEGSMDLQPGLFVVVGQTGTYRTTDEATMFRLSIYAKHKHQSHEQYTIASSIKFIYTQFTL